MQPLELEQLVMQYLAERGFEASLAAMQREAGSAYNEASFPPGELVRLTTGAVTLGEPVAESESAELSLLRSGAGHYPCVLKRTLEGVHAGNITSVRWAPGNRLVSGGADRLVAVSAPSGLLSSATLDAGVLCLDVHAASGLVAAGAMDGSVAVFALGEDGALSERARLRPHRKYAHAVRWHPGGALLASGSFDQTLVVYRPRPHTGEFAPLEQLHACRRGARTPGTSRWLAPGLRLTCAPLRMRIVRRDR
jgi:hypothetical protein